MEVRQSVVGQIFRHYRKFHYTVVYFRHNRGTKEEIEDSMPTFKPPHTSQEADLAHDLYEQWARKVFPLL
jgi:hypothetical protein